MQVVRLDSNPVLYAFASTLKALLRLDVATLDKTFRVEKFVKGRAKLERVQFTDADRGVTDITFTPM